MPQQAMPPLAMTWLMASLVMVMLPHVPRMPLWILLVYALAALWRLQMLRARLPMPAVAIRLLCGLGGALLVWLRFGTLIGLEPMVAVLLVATGLKLLEAVRLRDGYVLVCLGLFLAITQFLFSQSLPLVLWIMLSSVLLVTALILLNQTPGTRLSYRQPLLALRMLALAVPMMVALFLLFPRIDPLWSLPSRIGQGSTGMSDVLSPGSVSRLARSADVAFRAQFVDEVPSPSERYWRGMVLNRFEGGAWRRTDMRQLPPNEQTVFSPDRLSAAIRYRVIMEPSQQRWLYGLPYAQSNSPGVVASPDNHLLLQEPITGQFAYDVETWLGVRVDQALSPWRRDYEQQLPPGLNPRTRAWVAANGATTPRQFIDRVLAYFRTEPFYYTLEPPPIADEDFVDRFVFDTRRGFCEHYAYAFVVMMRMAGIPARVVGGYLGGEYNPVNNTLIVRQFDAHAWAEVWLAGEGWRRVDPTAAVAPERVSLGLEAALADDPGFLASSPLSAYRFKGIGLINWLRLRYDAVAWRWQAFVVGFDSDRQIRVLQSWFGELRPGWFVMVLFGSALLVLLPLTWWMHRVRRAPSPLATERRFAVIAEQLAQRGMARGPAEPPLRFLKRVRHYLEKNDPLLLELEQAVAALYQTPAQFNSGSVELKVQHSR